MSRNVERVGRDWSICTPDERSPKGRAKDFRTVRWRFGYLLLGCEAFEAGRTDLGGCARRRARLSRQVFHRLARPRQVKAVELGSASRPPHRLYRRCPGEKPPKKARGRPTAGTGLDSRD